MAGFLPLLEKGNRRGADEIDAYNLEVQINGDVLDNMGGLGGTYVY